MSVLVAEGLVGGYGGLDVLHGASVALGEREVVCIVGPNGAGKSTFLKAVFGLVRLKAGRVTVDGRDVTGSAPDAMVRAGLGYVPQVANVFPTLTVRENLEMGGFLVEDRARARAAIARVSAMFPALAEKADERAGRLSGGQRQMVALGRALVAEPRVLLLDEPSAGLQPSLQDLVFGHVRKVAESGVPVLLVEQNVRKALAIADRGYVFDQGKNRYEGPARDLLADENVGKLYLGG
ncbi:MAG TPA: ABC transporter ATP-binding protein [Candidatus Thermoplasmatota archaeon]|nr:ABC transporter ATP-binding protein [Candidatus Thermoplasmatota archaeon]